MMTAVGLSQNTLLILISSTMKLITLKTDINLTLSFGYSNKVRKKYSCTFAL